MKQKQCKVTFLNNPHENINPKTPKLYKSTNLGDEKRGLPLESDSLQNPFDPTSLKWSEMVKNEKFVKVRKKEWSFTCKRERKERVCDVF